MNSNADSDGCERAERVAAYATGSMAGLERESAEAHFVACSECRRELASYARFVAAADIDPAVDGIEPRDISALAAGTLPEARKRVREALRSRRAADEPDGPEGE